MNKILALITLVLLLGLNACGGNSGNTNAPEIVPETEIDLSKVISVSSLNEESESTVGVLTKREAIVCDKVTENVDNDIGCIYKSREYQYIMTNNSEYELTDIEISSSNPAFEVTPTRIKTIGVPNVNTVPTQLLTVGVNHKTPLYNLSESSTLPYGENTTTITIKGMVNGKEFNTTYTIGGFAYSMKVTYVVEDSIKLFTTTDNGTSIDTTVVAHTGCAYFSEKPDNTLMGLITNNGMVWNEEKQKSVDGVVKYCLPMVRIDGAPIFVNDKVVEEVEILYYPAHGTFSNNSSNNEIYFTSPFSDDEVGYCDNKIGKFSCYLKDSTGFLGYDSFININN